MEKITWDDFTRVELRVGRIAEAEVFKEAKKSAYKMVIDFGSEIGTRKTSSQITDRYSAEELVGRQVIAVINFPEKQIATIQSECLVTGFYHPDGGVVLAVPDSEVPNGTKLL